MTDVAQGDRPSKRSKRPSAHFTYLIGSGWEHVKIGHSSKPTARLSELQVGSTDDLRLLHQWKLTREEAKALERRLHAMFSWAAVRGEWFRIDWRCVQQVGDFMRSGSDETAAEIADGLHKLSALDAESDQTRRAWYNARPKSRRAAEDAAKVRRQEIEVEVARLTLALMDKGFHPPHIGAFHLQVHAARRRYEEIIRAAAEAAA